MSKKIFSVALLKIGGTSFDINTFSSIKDEDVDNLEINDKIQHNKIIKKEILDDRFVSIYFEEGGTTPRPEKVYNRNTQNDENNPRSIDQIERDLQTFILIDIRTQKIFMSDFRKKKTLENWLEEKIKKTVLIKNIIDKENFLNEIEGVNTIYLSAVPNLFSSMGILGDELINDYHNYGVGIKHIGVNISFEENDLPKKLKEKIVSLFQQTEKHNLKKLEISGRYDEKFERIFNAEGIIDKIEVKIAPLASGLFNAREVFDNLIQKIK